MGEEDGDLVVPGPETCRDNCIFCRIAANKEETELLYSDANFCAFRDIRPAARCHFLIIPRGHIRAVKDLTVAHIPMIREMEKIARQLLSEHAGDPDDFILGFHWPIYSIGHLHLHAQSPTCERSLFQKIEYSSWFFGTSEKAIEYVQKRSKM